MEIEGSDFSLPSPTPIFNREWSSVNDEQLKRTRGVDSGSSSVEGGGHGRLGENEWEDDVVMSDQKKKSETTAFDFSLASLESSPVFKKKDDQLKRKMSDRTISKKKKGHNDGISGGKSGRGLLGGREKGGFIGGLSDSEEDFVNSVKGSRKTNAAAAPVKVDPSFPVPTKPVSKMSKGEVVTYTRKQLTHLCMKQVRGTGVFKDWEKRIAVTDCSQRVQTILKGAGHFEDTIALGDIRSWAPGMKLGQGYTGGPGADDPEWIMYVSWHKFLIIVGDLLCRHHHVDPEKGEEEERFLKLFNSNSFKSMSLIIDLRPGELVQPVGVIQSVGVIQKVAVIQPDSPLTHQSSVQHINNR